MNFEQNIIAKSKLVYRHEISKYECLSHICDETCDCCENCMCDTCIDFSTTTIRCDPSTRYCEQHGTYDKNLANYFTLPPHNKSLEISVIKIAESDENPFASLPSVTIELIDNNDEKSYHQFQICKTYGIIRRILKYMTTIKSFLITKKTLDFKKMNIYYTNDSLHFNYRLQMNGYNIEDQTKHLVIKSSDNINDIIFKSLTDTTSISVDYND